MKQIYTQQVIENLRKNETQLGPENDRIVNDQVLFKRTVHTTLSTPSESTKL